MAGNFKMPSKKTTIIVGIIIAILAIVALTGTVVFLKDRGSTEAADLGNEQVSRQETETNSETQNEQGAQSSETTQSNGQTTPGGQIQSEGTTPTDNNPSTGTTGNTGTVETTGTTTRTNTTGNAGTTTTDSIQETTITRSELVKSGIDGLYVGWTPMGINAVLASANINAKTDDLAISKSVETKTGENLVTKGEEITYKITVTNNSERELKEVEIKDAIPEKTKYVEGSIDNDGEILKNSKNETVLRWNVDLGTEDENKEKVVSFKVKVEAEEGTIENVAIVNGKTTNKTQTAIIKASKVATIEGKKEKTAKVGDKVTYAITITNTGDIAGKAKVKDETFAKLIADGILELDETSVSKEMAERLKAGEEMDTEVPAKSNGEIRFKATVLKVSGAIKNIATVGEEKPEETVNTVNITSSKTPSKTEVKVGETFSYTITLNNSGNTAGTVKVKDTAPDGTTFVSAKVNQTNVNISETELAEGYEVTVPGKDGDVDGKVEITLFVKALEKKANNEYTDIVENTATMIDEGKPDQPVPSEDVKVSNIIAEKTSNYEGKAEGKELHELDTITYTIKLTNKGKANGTVKVSDDQPIGTQLIPDSIKVNGQGSYTLENLQKGIDVPVSAKDENNTDGTATLTFQVKVLTFEGTTKDIINDMAKKDNETVNTTTDMAKKLKTEKEAIKEWEDNNDKVGARPESVELELYANGTTTGTKKEASVINNWKVKFEGLNKYDAQGKEITYTVKEVGTVEHYKAETNGLKVTNTIDYTTFKTEKEAVKTWNDDNNKVGVRPEKVELELYANGTATGTKKEANATNNWKVKFEDLNKYDAQGEEITYTVKEVGTVEHYKAETNGLKVTNTIDYTSIKTEKEAVKTWNDDNNKAGVRPEKVELELYANGTATGTKKEANATNNWKVKFEDLNKYDAQGKEITYTVKEVGTVEHYKAEANGLKVTNTIDYTSIKTEKEAEKVWVDNNNKVGARPEKVELELYANGTTTGTKKEVTATNNWRVKFENLNKYDAQGKEITYTVKEVGTVEHYKAETNGLKVTNTIDYTTFKDKVTVTKTWTQEPEDTDVTTIRPATIELQLKSNNNVKYKHTINTATESSYEFEVEKYDANGNAITYEADENADLTNYDKSVNGYTITNAYKYAKLVPTKTAYKDVECTQKVNIENEADNFAPGQRVYYELTVTNKGKVNGSATLTDTLPESLENYRVESGNATINKTTLSWNATDLQPGATQKVIVSGTVKQNAQYVDIGTKQGGTSKVTAKLFVRKDGRIPFEGSNTPYDTKYYTNCVGTVYLNTNTAAAFGNLSDKDIYYLIDRNNDIVSKVQRGISHDELKVALARNEINLADDEVVIWYVNKWEDDGWHIDGAIRKISDLQKVTNTLTMVQNDNKATATVSADIKLKTISSIATTNLLSAVLAKVEDDTINTENVDAISEKVNKKDAEVNETKTVTKTEQTNIPDKKVDSKEQSNIEEKEETTQNDSTNIDNSVEKPEKNEDSTNTNKEININKETENKEEVLNVEQIETTN